MEIARLRSFVAGCFQVRKNEIPKRMYSDVHTGPNIQLGGLKEGWFSVAYHSGIAFAVNIPAIAPRPKGRRIDTTNLSICLLFIVLLFILI